MTGSHEIQSECPKCNGVLVYGKWKCDACGVTYVRKVTEPPVSDWEHIAQIAMIDVLALQKRLLAAEKLLLADETIEILHGDMNLDTVKVVLTAIDQHWQDYPEPLE